MIPEPRQQIGHIIFVYVIIKWTSHQPSEPERDPLSPASTVCIPLLVPLQAMPPVQLCDM